MLIFLVRMTTFIHQEQENQVFRYSALVPKYVNRYEIKKLEDNIPNYNLFLLLLEIFWSKYLHTIYGKENWIDRATFTFFHVIYHHSSCVVIFGDLRRVKAAIRCSQIEKLFLGGDLTRKKIYIWN